ncbi:MAG: gliding motility-associated C-terminal domain-containing protein [Chitinophagaceae bacterium]|nr:gliding motility-associated C-terminal domain-containing protein [Chitinophagaceae bacterium]
MNNSSTIISCKAKKVIEQINVGNKPEGITVNQALKKVYISNKESNSVSVINGCTNVVEHVINNAGIQPVGIAISPDGHRLYVCSYGSDFINVFSTDNYALLASITVGQGQISAPSGIIVSPDNKRIYVNLFDENKVAVINAVTNAVVAYYSTGNRPVGIDISKDGTKIFIANQNSNSLQVLDAFSGATITSVRLGPDADPLGVGGAAAIVLNHANSRAYVTIQDSSTVKVVDLLSYKIIGSIAVGNRPFGIDITLNDSSLYVSCVNSNQVIHIKTATNEVKEKITTGQKPYCFGKFIMRNNIETCVINVIPVACNNYILRGEASYNTTPITAWTWQLGLDKFSYTQNTSARFEACSLPVKLVVTDNYGCKDSASLILEGCDSAADKFLFVPTAFTPNNDGLNDCFKIIAPAQLTEIEIAIYNRWGQRVFFTTNPMLCWDGCFRDEIIPGNYVCFIRYKPRCKDFKIEKYNILVIK